MALLADGLWCRGVASPVAGVGAIRLADVFASLSLATDLGNGFSLGKALRNSLLATRPAGMAGMEQRLAPASWPRCGIAAVYRCTALDYEMGSSFGDAAAARSRCESGGQ